MLKYIKIMLLINKKYTNILISLVLFAFTFVFLNTKVSAATLTLTNDCLFNEAIGAVNNAQDENGCIKTGDAYGTNDKINVPAGTTTLTTDGTTIIKDLIIEGAGKTSSIINGGDNNIITSNGNNLFNINLTIKNLTLTNAQQAAVSFNEINKLTIDNVDVNNSEQGINGIAQEIEASNCDVNDNNNPGGQPDNSAGINLSLRALTASDVPKVSITNCKVNNNESMDGAGFAGIFVNLKENSEEGPAITSSKISIKNTTISGNKASSLSGLFIGANNGPLTTTTTDLSVDSTTIANNASTVSTPITIAPGQAHLPVLSGAYLSLKLADKQNFTNVTVAFNTVNNPSPDNRNAMAGFFGTLSPDGANLRITYTTVVGNSASAPSSLTKFSSFTVVKPTINLENFPTIVVEKIDNGSSAENSLISNNKFNNESGNCNKQVDLNVFGFNGTLDATPTNLGYNLSDDQTCTGYKYVANLNDTIDNQVKDNGGPVPTIKLLPGSPAIDAGGQVLGLSTDARGVAREGYYSVGAYQGVRLASSTNTSKLAETGVITISVVAVSFILILSLAFIYLDYRKHKKPLTDVDPNVSYTFMHHIRVVTIPLFKYRLSIKISKANPMDKDGVHRF